MNKIEEIEQKIKKIIDDIQYLKEITEVKRSYLYTLSHELFLEQHRIEKEQAYIRGILDLCRTGK